MPIFGPTTKSEKSDAETAAMLAEVTEDLGSARFRRRFFFLFAALNAAVWLAAVVFAQRLYHLFTEVFSVTDTPGIVALSLPFGFGFYSAYALLRIWFPDIEDNKQLGSAMMSSYGYNSDAAKRWRVWVAAAAFAVLNTFLLVALVSGLGGGSPS